MLFVNIFPVTDIDHKDGDFFIDNFAKDSVAPDSVTPKTFQVSLQRFAVGSWRRRANKFLGDKFRDSNLFRLWKFIKDFLNASIKNNVPLSFCSHLQKGLFSSSSHQKERASHLPFVPMPRQLLDNLDGSQKTHEGLLLHNSSWDDVFLLKHHLTSFVNLLAGGSLTYGTSFQKRTTRNTSLIWGISGQKSTLKSRWLSGVFALFLTFPGFANEGYRQGSEFAKENPPTLSTGQDLFSGTSHEGPPPVYDPRSLEDTARIKFSEGMGDVLKESSDNRDLNGRLQDDGEMMSLLDVSSDVVEDPKSALGVTETIETTEAAPRHGCTILECDILKEEGEYQCTQTRVVDVASPPEAFIDIEVQAYGHGGGAYTQRRNLETGSYVDGIDRGSGSSSHTLNIPELPEDVSKAITKIEVLEVHNNVGHVGKGSIWVEGKVLLSRPNGPFEYRKKKPALLCNTRATIRVTYQPKDIIKERIEDKCAAFKDKDCTPIREEILEGAEVRIFGGESVEAPWWQKRQTYRCEYHEDGLRSCDAYKRDPLCRVTRTECRKREGGECILFRKRYECCPAPQEGERRRLSGDGGEIFCLDGDCADKSYAPNKKALDTFAKLSILKEVKKGIDEGSIKLFKGAPYQCSKSMTSYKDCCRKGRGWGRSLGLATCTPTEKELGALRAEKKCVYGGRFCAERRMGVCIRKKSSYCCFGSKLSRVLQEQIRRKRGFSFGTPEHPNCRGLEIEELQEADFDDMDFSEIFEEIKVAPLDGEKLKTRFEEKWKTQLGSSKRVRDRRGRGSSASRGGRDADIVF